MSACFEAFQVSPSAVFYHFPVSNLAALIKEGRESPKEEARSTLESRNVLPPSLPPSGFLPPQDLFSHISPVAEPNFLDLLSSKHQSQASPGHEKSPGQGWGRCPHASTLLHHLLQPVHIGLLK